MADASRSTEDSRSTENGDREREQGATRGGRGRRLLGALGNAASWVARKSAENPTASMTIAGAVLLAVGMPLSLVLPPIGTIMTVAGVGLMGTAAYRAYKGRASAQPRTQQRNSGRSSQSSDEAFPERQEVDSVQVLKTVARLVERLDALDRARTESATANQQQGREASHLSAQDEYGRSRQEYRTTERSPSWPLPDGVTRDGRESPDGRDGPGQDRPSLDDVRYEMPRPLGSEVGQHTPRNFSRPTSPNPPPSETDSSYAERARRDSAGENRRRTRSASR